MPVRFRLADGVRVTGDLTAWDAEGLEGSFGRRQWTDCLVDDVWTLMRRLMDQDAAADWVVLGGVLLQMDGGADWSERAFRQALRLDPDVAPAIEQARQAAAARRDQREAELRAVEAQRLSTSNPEAAPWSADPWPVLSEAEQTVALTTMRNDGKRILKQAGMSIATVESEAYVERDSESAEDGPAGSGGGDRLLTPVESEAFIVYSDLPRLETARWARQLDLAYQRLREVLDLDPAWPMLWGKAVVFILTDREQSRLIEAQAFGQLVSGSFTGIAHYEGPKVFINCYRQPDDDQFGADLVYHAMRGVLHWHRTPKRLPPWATEGLSHAVAAAVLERSTVANQRRARGLAYVRGGGNVAALLQLDYDDEAWPGPDAVGPAVGELLIDLMRTNRPRQFARWVAAVKLGKPWPQALREDYGVTPPELLSVFQQFYAVND